MDLKKISYTSAILVGGILSLQLYANVYTSYLQAQNLHRKNNIIQVSMLVFRAGIGISVIRIWKSVEYFFLSQLLSTLANVIILRLVSYEHCASKKVPLLYFNYDLIKCNIKFLKVMAATSCVSSLLIASDRLLLMWLTDSLSFVRYSLALALANLCSLVVLPFYKVYFPRFNLLCQSQKFIEAKLESTVAMRQLAAVLMPVSTALHFSCDLVFEIWIGSERVGVPIMFQALNVGMVMAGLLWMPAAYLQAAGRSSFHLSTMIISLILGTVIAYFAIIAYGPIGGSFIWITHGVIGLSIEFALIYGPHFKTVVDQLVRVLAYPTFGSILVAIGSKIVIHKMLANQVKLSLIAVLVIAIVGSSVIIEKHLGQND